jgi:tetratricopeptide (TPR) repeat protein
VFLPVTEPSHAVFLSYASQDAEAAQKICQALRAAGIEVWFDQSELRGGDAWDTSIRRQIKSCALFIHIDAGLAVARRAVVLDPLARDSHSALGRALYAARRYEEAVVRFSEGISLDPGDKPFYTYRGFAYYGLGDLEGARASCETKRDFPGNQWCLTVTYDKLGRHADAEAELLKLKAAYGDVMAYQYAAVYAQRGDHSKALEWLETALRLRDSCLESLKSDSLMDPIRQEPRFQEIERKLKFPD